MAKAVVHFQPKIKNLTIYYATVNVLFDKSIQWINVNPNTYYCTANVFIEKYYDTYRDKFSVVSYPYINFRSDTYVKQKYKSANNSWNIASTFVSMEAPITKTSELWSSYTNVLTSYIVKLGSASTLEFDRLNSNIYKNIFNHLIFDLSLIKENIFGLTYKKETSIFQLSHGLSNYDLLYLDKHGFYRKAIADKETEKCFVCGIVSNVINDNEFTIMTHGIIPNNHNFQSDAGILYLSDKIEGQFSIYEDIDNMVYTPVGFYNDDHIVINILDTAIDNRLKLYQDTILNNTEFTYLSDTDINDIIVEVINNDRAAR